MNRRLYLALLIASTFPLTVAAQQSFGQSSNTVPADEQSQYNTPAAQQPQNGYGRMPAQDGYGSAPAQGNNSQARPPNGYGSVPTQSGYGQMPSQRGYGQAPQPAGFGAAPQAGDMGGNPMQAALATEMQDFGIAPQAQLQTQLHGPTPTSIPGGHTITTDRLLALYQQGQQTGLLVFDVLGSGYTLPMAQNAVGAAEPGSFNDQVQRNFGQFLQQTTQGNTGRPMVFYCQGPHCWMSYNAALRAIHLGYRQVYWYRGGVEAWQSVQQMAARGSQQQRVPAMQYSNDDYRNRAQGNQEQDYGQRR